MNQHFFSNFSDSPLTHIGDDEFGRESLVELIVDSINDLVKQESHDSMVYGIYGKWGDGKTSLMNFIKERLLGQGKKDKINLIEFNPWLVNNEEALLREFFNSIITDIETELKAVFKKYGSLAIFASKTIVNAFIPGVGLAIARGLKMAKKALEDCEETLSELKKNVSEAIVKKGRHLVIMIDDLDRLDKEELHATLRLIRQVADFKNCIYIVAMDPDMVAKSISDYHGGKSVQDGRQFLCKIVQRPISLPHIPQEKMRDLINKELSSISQEDDIVMKDIVDAVYPFIGNYRDLKRYCNQLSFVLPNLKGEVNLLDLCVLEAIKMISGESYRKVHECGAELRREEKNLYLNKEEQQVRIENNYQEAKKYITYGLDSRLKAIIESALDDLFRNGQNDIDKKRLITSIYFPKYFIQSVPMNLIPDRKLDVFVEKFFNLDVNAVAGQLDDWNNLFSASEVQRAILYVIRRFNEDRSTCCKAASIGAKALSIGALSKGFPPHISTDIDNFAKFVSLRVIYRYMFVQDESYTSMNVLDEDTLDETLSFIFSNGELNYCLNFLCFSEALFSSGCYYGTKVFPILIERYKEIGFDRQFQFSKFLLAVLFKYWKQTDVDSFNKYANDLFSNPEYDLGRIFDKFIDGHDDAKNVVVFKDLFLVQIPKIHERLMQEDELKHKDSVRIYLSH